jgi:deoxyinosine 3'endonuclease (endonuclease V)
MKSSNVLSFCPDSLESLQWIGGCDISYLSDGRAIACVVILEFPLLKVVHEQLSEVIDLNDQPYIPGHLALRFASV